MKERKCSRGGGKRSQQKLSLGGQSSLGEVVVEEQSKTFPTKKDLKEENRGEEKREQQWNDEETDSWGGEKKESEVNTLDEASSLATRQVKGSRGMDLMVWRGRRCSRHLP